MRSEVPWQSSDTAPKKAADKRLTGTLTAAYLPEKIVSKRLGSIKVS
jgi:hypothetical protein